jgi:hypothetical protein
MTRCCVELRLRKRTAGRAHTHRQRHTCECHHRRSSHQSTVHSITKRDSEGWPNPTPAVSRRHNNGTRRHGGRCCSCSGDGRSQSNKHEQQRHHTGTHHPADSDMQPAKRGVSRCSYAKRGWVWCLHRVVRVRSAHNLGQPLRGLQCSPSAVKPARLNV